MISRVGGLGTIKPEDSLELELDLEVSASSEVLLSVLELPLLVFDFSSEPELEVRTAGGLGAFLIGAERRRYSAS